MVKDEVFKILSEVMGLSQSEISESDLLVDDLNLDSLDAVDLVVALEQHFNVRVADEDVENLRTVADLVQIVEAKTGVKI